MKTIDDLLQIMTRLRDPERGCPWDLRQNFATIAPYTIEEAYEVADAIDRRDYADLRDELGDLLLQVVFHARMAEEAGHFAFAEVVESICAKMIRRHPRVRFDENQADESGKVEKVENAAEHTVAWETHKQRERMAKGNDDASALAGISRGLPEWQRALKLQKCASSVGFDSNEPGPVLDKLEEEIGEVRAELAMNDDAHDAVAQTERLTDEIGDVLFVAINLARLAKVDYSQALRGANAKFERRFRRMEALAAADGCEFKNKSFAEQEIYWQRAKTEDKAGCSSRRK